MVYRLASRMPQWKKNLAKKYAKNLTGPEEALWERLKNKQLGVWIYKQKAMCGFIVDFWFPGGIVIEVDGPCHRFRKAKDKKRDAIFAAKGIRTMRFTSDEIKNNLGAVVALIADAI